MVLSDCDFGFVFLEGVRLQLKLDAGEMDVCIEHGANKAAIVMAGSLIERLLVHILKTKSVFDPQASGFWQLIQQAQRSGMLTKGTRSACDSIRSYRNLIHPDIDLSDVGLRPDANTASLSAQLVTSVLKEVASTLARTQKDLDILLRYLDDPATLPGLAIQLGRLDSGRLKLLYCRIRDEVIEPRRRGESPAAALQRFMRYRALWDKVHDRLSLREREEIVSSFLERVAVYPVSALFGWHSEDAELLDHVHREQVAATLLQVCRSLGSLGPSSDSQVVACASSILAAALSTDLRQAVMDDIGEWFVDVYTANNAGARPPEKPVVRLLNLLTASAAGRAALRAAISKERSRRAAFSPESRDHADLDRLDILLDKAADFTFDLPG